MGITFSAQDRLAITRSEIQIPIQNAGYQSAITSITAQQNQYLQTDNLNNEFYSFYRIQSDSYENEARAINGQIPASYTDGTVFPFSSGDLVNSAQYPGSAAAVFFPSSPVYIYNIPLITNAVNGILNPTGTDSLYENNILSNPSGYSGLVELLNFLLNGTSGSGSTGTTSTNIPAGPLTNYLVIMSSTSFSSNEVIYITDGVNSGIYKIVSFTGSSITIDSIVPTLIGISASATATDTASGFTNTERESLTTGSGYQEILNNLASDISTLITNWSSKLSTEIANLTNQNDTRTLQSSQNSTALSNANAAQSVISTWQSLPNTGIGGKYSDSGLAPIQSEIATRQSFLPTRISQILTALGSVSQIGNSYFGTAGNTYYERYLWLNIRINRIDGSATRYFLSNNGIAQLNNLINDNNTVNGQYNQYFVTQAITMNNGTNIIQVKFLTGFSQGDRITIVSETQSEIVRAIIAFSGTNQIKLDQPLPNTYLVSDIARIFKYIGS